MNVLCITDSTYLGGAEIQILSLLRGVVDAGHRVGLVCSTRAFAEQARAAGVDAEPLPHPLGTLRGIVSGARAIRRACRAGGVQVLHAEGLRSAVAAALARAGLKPRPGLVLTIHSRDPRRTIASHALAARVLRTTGGLLTTVSESERRRYLARGFPEDRCLTIHNGVPLPKPVTEDRRLRARAVLGRQCQERIVAHVGRLVPVKGHTVLLRALAGLRTRPDVLLVAGEGPLRGALEADCRRLGLEGTVVFLGFRDDIATVLYASDLLVLPSLSEVLPMAVLEAMAIGLPVVATRVGGIPELIEDGREGWLVDPDDPEALRVALEAALADPAARAARGSAARRRVEREFTSEAMVHATLAAYARAMERER